MYTVVPNLVIPAKAGIYCAAGFNAANGRTCCAAVAELRQQERLRGDDDCVVSELKRCIFYTLPFY